MQLCQFLSSDRILVAPAANDKWELIDLLITLLHQAGDFGSVLELEPLQNSVLERERQLSTALELGLAMPHGMIDGDIRTQAALAILPEGMEFESMDQQPTYFVCLFAFPNSPEGKNLHLSLLSDCVKLFTNESLKSPLLAASTATEVMDLILNSSK